jgi:hypothetical protein
MGVTESKEDQKLQEIWAVVDEDSDDEDKLKKQKKVLTQGVKLTKPAGDTTSPSSSSTTSASSVPTKPISHPESPFPGIRLRTEEDGDAATTKGEEIKEQAVEPVAPGDEGAPPLNKIAPCYSQSILMCRAFPQAKNERATSRPKIRKWKETCPRTTTQSPQRFVATSISSELRLLVFGGGIC